MILSGFDLSSITFGQVLQFLKDCSWILIILGMFFEITKIKVNPFKWVLDALFSPVRREIEASNVEINKKIDEKFGELDKKIDQLAQRQEAQEEKVRELIRSNEMDMITRIRWEIIEFSNSIENSQLHTRDEYLHVKDNFQRYHKLIEKNEMTNLASTTLSQNQCRSTTQN